jgi:hypothetical protein
LAEFWAAACLNSRVEVDLFAQDIFDILDRDPRTAHITIQVAQAARSDIRRQDHGVTLHALPSDMTLKVFVTAAVLSCSWGLPCFVGATFVCVWSDL